MRREPGHVGFALHALRALPLPGLALGLGLGLGLSPGAAPSAAADAPAKRLAGSVLLLDAEKRQLVLLDAGKRHTVTWSAETVVRQGNRDRAIAGLKRGERVVVTLDASDATRAAIIAVAGAAAPGAQGDGLLPGAAPNVPGFAPGLNARPPPR